MNAIEALKESSYGAIEFGGNKAIYNSIDLIWDVTKIEVSMTQIMNTGWKIYKEKKTLIIEDVFWCKNSGGIFPNAPEKDINFWKLLINKPKMKMILEWKE